jgi:hypothetical protein
VNLQRGILAVSVFLGSLSAHALSSTSVLPVGINSPSFRYGIVDGISEKYTENGALMNLGDYKSVLFDAAHLAKFNKDAQKLIDALNRFGAQGAGNDFNLGVLRIDTKPQVKYFAPVFAHGFTEKWTLGVGIPMITYKNEISMAQQFSNIEYYRRQYSGLSAELDSALNTDLRQATKDTLKSKGYRALDNRDESFLGDVQVVSLYQFFTNPTQALTYSAQVNTPTGPQYDPDDLAAMNIFGRTYVTNTMYFSQRLGSRWTVVPMASWLINVPDHIDARVPTDEDDTLPDESSKQNVERQIGNTIAAGGNLFYEVMDGWTLGTGYEYAIKARDQYRGNGTGRYDLLSQNSESRAQRVKGEIAYSSVNSYFNKTALIPVMVSFEISDTIAGLNVERQTTQELNLMMFF